IHSVKVRRARSSLFAAPTIRRKDGFAEITALFRTNANASSGEGVINAREVSRSEVKLKRETTLPNRSSELLEIDQIRRENVALRKAREVGDQHQLETENRSRI